MNAEQAIQTLGGGPAALIIVTLCGVIVTLFYLYNKAQQGRIDDKDAHKNELIDVIKVVDRAMEFLERKNRD